MNTISQTILESAALSSQIQLFSQPGEEQLGFGSRYLQHELPFETMEAAKNASRVHPGPGSYEHDVERSSEIKGHMGNFKPTIGTCKAKGGVATEIPCDAKGDPGAYNPNQLPDREINYQAKKTFREPARQVMLFLRA